MSSKVWLVNTYVKHENSKIALTNLLGENMVQNTFAFISFQTTGNIFCKSFIFLQKFVAI